MDLFNINPGLAVWTWISFGLLFLLLSKFAFPSLLKNLKNREELIAESVDNAGKIKTKLVNIEKDHKEILLQTKREADEILRTTREEARQLKKSLLEQAEKEAQGLLDQARVRINEDRVAVMELLRNQIANFACDTAEQIIGRSFVTEEDRKWTVEIAEKL